MRFLRRELRRRRGGIAIYAYLPDSRYIFMDVPLRWTEDKHSVQGMLDHTHWSPAQSRVWVPALFSGLVALMASRISLPVCMAEMAQDLQWDKREQVGGVVINMHHALMTITTCISPFFFSSCAHQRASYWRPSSGATYSRR